MIHSVALKKKNFLEQLFQRAAFFACALLILLSPEARAEEKPEVVTLRKSFNIFDSSSIKLVLKDIQGEVSIITHPANRVEVTIAATLGASNPPQPQPGSASNEAHPLDEFFTVLNANNTISVIGKHQPSSVTVESTGENITILSGAPSAGNQIIINGQNLSNIAPKTPSAEQVKVTIKIPARSTPNVELRSVSALRAEGVTLGKMQLTHQGVGTFNLGSLSTLTAKASGTTTLTVKNLHSLAGTFSGVTNGKVENVQGGNLDIALQGSSTFTASGNFQNLTLTASGSSQIQTQGEVSKNFTGNASGASRVIHTGTVKGEVKRNATGASQVEIR